MFSAEDSVKQSPAARSGFFCLQGARLLGTSFQAAKGKPSPSPAHRQRPVSPPGRTRAPLTNPPLAVLTGKAYVRDKVCQEFQALGKEDFRTL